MASYRSPLLRHPGRTLHERSLVGGIAEHQLRYSSIHTDGAPLMDIVIPSAASIGLFAVAATLLLLTPGPAVLYIVARSVEHGRKAGLASVFGVELGNSIHVLAATIILER